MRPILIFVCSSFARNELAPRNADVALASEDRPASGFLVLRRVALCVGRVPPLCIAALKNRIHDRQLHTLVSVYRSATVVSRCARKVAVADRDNRIPRRADRTTGVHAEPGDRIAFELHVGECQGGPRVGPDHAALLSICGFDAGRCPSMRDRELRAATIEHEAYGRKIGR